MKNQISLLLSIAFLFSVMHPAACQDVSRWSLGKDGSIKWEVKEKDSHLDHVEMSGFYMSAIVQYGVKNGVLEQNVELIFPMLRTVPNDTHASLSHTIKNNELPKISIDGKPVVEYPVAFYHRGKLTYQSRTMEGLEIRHQLFPSVDQPVFIEKVEITNTIGNAIVLDIPAIALTHTTDKSKGVSGAYVIEVTSNKTGRYTLDAHSSMEYAIIYSARVAGTDASYVAPDYELLKRDDFVNNTFSDLVFESPNEVLNRSFAFAKLRAVESIFKTKGGMMHAPGGGRYYAAIWANDQAEYADPFFPFLGNFAGNESAINSFRHFARYINKEYKPIPSSIIAEGLDFWNGAGDRGDMAMIAYGASRFALAYGDKKTAQELWPLIEWCLEFCKRKVNDSGVVASDSDELEGRFPAGKANLNTSSLYYDALLSAVFLGNELKVDPKQLDTYQQQAKALKGSIDKYFGATLDGFETYRYYDGNKTLRAWICTPLTVNIFDRSKGTIDALFSEKLWTADGLASESGSTTFWDRATLYALRGVFAAGETRRAMDFLTRYSKRRLLGEHVPYPVEAYPEGNQRHLSAESALYCRIITEGLFGIRPTGFGEFTMAPKLPEEWDSMDLKNIKAFNHTFTISVKREGNKLLVKVYGTEKTYLSTSVNKDQVVRVKF